MSSPTQSSTSSRSASPTTTKGVASYSDSPSKAVISPTKLAEQVKDFFQPAKHEGLTSTDANKVQPWREFWKPEEQEDGKCIVTCDERCDYGSNNVGGV